MTVNRLLRGGLVVLAMLGAVPAVHAEDYPSKPVHMIMPFLGGGAVDLLARVYASKLSEYWGQQVLVEDKPGAGGNLGSSLVASAPPDGYTLLVAPHGPLSYNAVLYKSMPYDPKTAFAPISLLARSPNFLIVPKDSPLNSLDDLINLAKAQPGKVYYGSQGNGTTPHLTGAMLGLRAGIEVVHVPYRGAPPLFTDLISGRLTFVFADSGNTLPRVRDGLIKVFAITSDKRWPALPDVKTMAELGYPNFLSAVWYALAAPAKTPPTIVGKIHEGIMRANKDPAVIARLNELGVEVVGSTPAEMARILADETARWSEVIRATGVTVE